MINFTPKIVVIFTFLYLRKSHNILKNQLFATVLWQIIFIELEKKIRYMFNFLYQISPFKQMQLNGIG